MNIKSLSIAIVIAALLITGVIIYTNYPGQEKPGQASEGPEETSSSALSSQEAGEMVINYINDILKGRATASLVEAVEENGLYKIKFSIGEEEIESYITLDGKLFFPEGIDLREVEVPAEETGFTIGNFSVSAGEICKEEGKPIIYFFGSEGCGYCKWEHPLMEEVAEKFEAEIAFHNNMDSEADRDVFEKYSTGGIPTLVFGCKYYRVGAGTNHGEEKEIEYLTALICKLTDAKPANVCVPLEDLINQIE